MVPPGHPAWAEIPAKGFEPPTSYMGVRNMMEHEGIIFVDGALDTEGAIGLAGGWQCRDRHEVGWWSDGVVVCVKCVGCVRDGR